MNHVAKEVVNYLAGCRLDRVPAERKQADWVSAISSASSTRFVPIHQSKVLLVGDKPLQVAYLSGSEALPLIPEANEVVVLGLHDGAAYVALDLNDAAAERAEALSGAAFASLKPVGHKLAHHDAAVLAYARAMTWWHRSHRYCGLCGSPTEVGEGGAVRRCLGCQKSHFPRTDGAVIVLIFKGDRCLLARSASWPEKVYATVAGFLEPGESLEDCVRREILEETGLKVEDITYHSSQPWPFPGSIMIGFFARAINEEVCLDQDELEDARWFTADQIRQMVAAKELILPSAISISYRLVADWLEGR